ncbi:amino acid decarboxylase [Ruegeria marisrubri]|uniref:Amino acid decarboxylase n=1 Tax=Ruegeria marisrubri TaxID=1685379 RepID=A0A0X3TVL1_9RHOB|nr:pyridoxal-dependent decarboxylase [Ruegeria marisrubri]KUJ79728.1 amino acid decarboxylase [Ruegeria marisrubri]
MAGDQKGLEETLDPEDWETMRRLSYRIVDDAIEHLRSVRDRPVWQQMPAEVLDGYQEGVPEAPEPLEKTYDLITKNLLPYSLGNIHPRYWMWYMGSGSYAGALAEFLAAIDGSNVGGGNMAASEMDRQVVGWLKEMMGFPTSASGTLVSGGTMANLIALNVARNANAGVDLRRESISSMPQPQRFYASDQAHSCHGKALGVLGLGENALQKIRSDSRTCRIDLSALATAVSEDRSNGVMPACVIATAGSVNSGAIDDLTAIAEFCEREGLWFHIDGCIGALVRIAPRNRHLVEGLERADSVALDPHKWLHVPFEAGCVIIRDAELHRRTFSVTAEYLEEFERGIAPKEYLHAYNIQTSRGFRALKVWMTLRHYGVEKLGRLIDQNISQAAYLRDMIVASNDLELMAPVLLNIVCFRFRTDNHSEDELRHINTEIMLRLQEKGIAAPSDTTIAGRHCLRVAIVNHRTRKDDLDLLVAEVRRIGTEIIAEGAIDQLEKGTP